MKVAEVCDEKIQTITQHQVKRLTLSVIKLVSSKCVRKGAGYGHLQSNPQRLTWRKRKKRGHEGVRDQNVKGQELSLVSFLVTQPACKIPRMVRNLEAQKQFMTLQISLTS